jgi:hypothetical protein
MTLNTPALIGEAIVMDRRLDCQIPTATTG